MLVNIFTLSFSSSYVFFLSTFSIWMMKIPWGLSDNEGSNMIEKEKKVWKQNVCQLTPCIRRSQSVDDHHWLDEHSTHTCSITREEKNQEIFFAKSKTWWCRCYRRFGVFIHSFIHQDRWCSVYWLVYLFKLMLRRTAVRWIQSPLTCTNVCSKLRYRFLPMKIWFFKIECFCHSWEYSLGIIRKSY